MNFQIPFLSKICDAFFFHLSQGKLCLKLQYEAPPGSEPETAGGGEEGEEEGEEGGEDEEEEEEGGEGGEEGAEPGKPGQPKKKRRKRYAVMFIFGVVRLIEDLDQSRDGSRQLKGTNKN